MMSDQEFRKHLPKDKECTDEEVNELRRVMYGLADLAFDKWVKEKGIKVDKLNAE